MSIPPDGKILPFYSFVNNAHIGKTNGKGTNNSKSYDMLIL